MIKAHDAIDNTRRVAHDAISRANESIRGLRSGVSELTNRGMNSVGEYTHATTRYVGEHPLKTALIAAAVGAAVAGIVIAMRRHRDSHRYDL